MSRPTPTELIERFGDVAREADQALRSAGVDRWELFAKASSWCELTWRPEERSTSVECRETGLAVRTRRSGRTGFAAAAGVGADVARRALDAALAVERNDPIDPLPPSDILGAEPTRPSPPRPPRGWMAHTAETIARALAYRSGGGRKVDRIQVREGIAGWVLRTAEGITLSHEGTSCLLLVEVGLGDGRDSVWRELAPVDEPGKVDGEAIAERIADRLHLLSGPLNVPPAGLDAAIIDAPVAAHLFGALAPFFMASSPTGEQSRPTDRCGEGVAAPCLSVLDDRSGSRGPIRAPCDAEGLPSRPVPLIDCGRRRHRLALYRDALRLGQEPVGGAVRLSYKTPPRTGITNLLVLPDDGLAPRRLLDEAGRAIYLIRLSAPPRVHPDGDRLTFAGIGVPVDGGRVQGGPVSVRVRTEITELLRNIAAVGTDLQWRQTGQGSVGTPTLLIRPLEIS